MSLNDVKKEMSMVDAELRSAIATILAPVKSQIATLIVERLAEFAPDEDNFDEAIDMPHPEHETILQSIEQDVTTIMNVNPDLAAVLKISSEHPGEDEGLNEWEAATRALVYESLFSAEKRFEANKLAPSFGMR